jgi:hypothetical protein
MMLADLTQAYLVEPLNYEAHGGKAFGSGVPTLRQNIVTVLLPFLAYFGAIGDESGGECTKVSVAQVEGKTRTSSVLLAF